MDGAEELLLVDLQRAQTNHLENSKEGHDHRGPVGCVVEKLDERALLVRLETLVQPPHHLLDRNRLAVDDEIGALAYPLEHFPERADELEQVDLDEALLRLVSIGAFGSVVNGIRARPR